MPGSGKSTLASVIAGNEDYEVKDGEINFEGKDLLELAPEDLGLASYVCPSKYDYQSILDLNLEKMYEEFR